MSSSNPSLRPPIEYPFSDGLPMDSGIHVDILVDLISAIRSRARSDGKEIYAAGNIFVYYVEGDPSKSVGPDFFLVRGVPNHPRHLYKVWEEKKGPELVIELASRSTFRHDLEGKKALYERLGVLEYYVFDCGFGLFEPPFRAFRRVAEELVEVEGERRADGTIVFASELVSLELHGLERSLRWVDPETGEALPNLDEESHRADEASRRAEGESRRAEDASRRADEAEAKLRESRCAAEELLAELERLRAEARDGPRGRPS